VVLYSGMATGRDFLALELFDGQVRYVYDVGGGVRSLRVNLRYSVNDNRWHQVAIVRSTLTEVSISPRFVKPLFKQCIQLIYQALWRAANETIKTGLSLTVRNYSSY